VSEEKGTKSRKKHAAGESCSEEERDEPEYKRNTRDAAQTSNSKAQLKTQRLKKIKEEPTGDNDVELSDNTDKVDKGKEEVGIKLRGSSLRRPQTDANKLNLHSLDRNRDSSTSSSSVTSPKVAVQKGTLRRPPTINRKTKCEDGPPKAVFTRLADIHHSWNDNSYMQKYSQMKLTVFGKVALTQHPKEGTNQPGILSITDGTTFMDFLFWKHAYQKIKPIIRKLLPGETQVVISNVLANCLHETNRDRSLYPCYVNCNSDSMSLKIYIQELKPEMSVMENSAFNLSWQQVQGARRFARVDMLLTIVSENHDQKFTVNGKDIRKFVVFDRIGMQKINLNLFGATYTQLQLLPKETYSFRSLQFRDTMLSGGSGLEGYPCLETDVFCCTEKEAVNLEMIARNRNVYHVQYDETENEYPTEINEEAMNLLEKAKLFVQKQIVVIESDEDQNEDITVSFCSKKEGMVKERRYGDDASHC